MALTAYGPTNATASGSANVKGSYTQIVASTPYASSRLYLSLLWGSGAWQAFYIDIAVGAAASEVVKVPDVYYWADTEAVGAQFVAIDVDIPAGSRIAVRCQCSTGSAVATIGLHLEDRALTGLAAPVTYGLSGASRGTALTAGSANVKGSYTQITASTSAAITELIVIAQVVSTGLATWRSFQIDIATGGAGSETIVIPDIFTQAGTLTDASRPTMFRFPVSIAASTRIAARCASSAASANIDITLIALTTPASGGSAVPVAVGYAG